MDRIFFFGGNTGEAHNIAYRMGFRRGEYIVIIGHECNHTRGLKGRTMYVVGSAADRKDYEAVVGDVLTRDFIVVYIDDEVLNLIEG